MDIWVLGCGPSLDEVEIPEDVFTIGTNDSYLRHWSPVYVTTDANALRRDYPENKAMALVYYSAIQPHKPIPPIEILPGRPMEVILRPERPSLRKSGVFALWLAIHAFKATRVHLLGFDMEANGGHFPGASHRAGEEQSYKAQRLRLKALADEVEEAWIWQTDRFIPLRNIPADKFAFDSANTKITPKLPGMSFVRMTPEEYKRNYEWQKH